MKLKDFITIDTIFSILGSVSVAFGQSFPANCLWSVGNVFLIIRNYNRKDYPQMLLFCIFEVVSIVGIINHFAGVY